MSAKKLFTKMGHAGIQVKDVAKSVAFFKDVLGFDVAWSGDSDWANMSLGGDDLGLIKKASNKHPAHIGLRVDSLESLKDAHAHLLKCGVKAEKIHGHRDGSQSFYFADLDGNDFEALYMPKK